MNTITLTYDHKSGRWTAKIGTGDKHLETGGTSAIEALSALTIALHHAAWKFDCGDAAQ